MNDTLKAVGNIGAELGAAKAENEKLREVLRCIADLPMDRCSTENDYRLSAAKAIALGALSQQDEPVPAQDEREACDSMLMTGEICTQRKGHDDPCGPAEWFTRPAQTEQQPWDDGMVRDFLSVALRHVEVKGTLHSQDIRDALRYMAERYTATPVAQAEQQPVSWQFYQAGKWWNGDDRIKDHRKNTEAAGIPVRDLYAAPIAQTAPQPEQSGRNEYMPLELIGILQRYKRDLELRTFLDNDEGDYQLRWTAKEIARVSAALSAQGESHE